MYRVMHQIICDRCGATFALGETTEYDTWIISQSQTTESTTHLCIECSTHLVDILNMEGIKYAPKT